MRKLLSLCLTISLMFLLVGCCPCMKKEKPQEAPETTEPAPEAPAK